MKFLVLGGTGFIGMNLCKKLIDKGHKVRIISRSIPNECKSILIFNSEFVDADFMNIKDFSPYLEDVDIIFHLISTTIPATSNRDRVYDISSNVIPTLNLLDSAVKNKIKKVIFLSSGGTVYGIPKVLPIPEGHPTEPICSYAIQKLTIEKYLHFYYLQYGLDYTVLRLSNPYGTGQTGLNGQGAVAVFLKHIINKEPIEIWGDGSTVRDYIHINDVISAMIACIGYEGKYKIFNIGSGYGLSLSEVIKIISDICNLQCNIRYLEGRKIDVTKNVLDISRAKKELKWEPKVNFVEGIERLINGN